LIAAQFVWGPHKGHTHTYTHIRTGKLTEIFLGIGPKIECQVERQNLFDFQINRIQIKQTANTANSEWRTAHFAIMI